MPGRHDHHGVLQPGYGRTNGTDSDRIDRCAVSQVRRMMMSGTTVRLPEEDQELSRRKFFTQLGLGSLVVAGAGTLAFYYHYLSPNVLFEASPIVNAGKAENYPVDSVTLDATS